jgi:hypothetical protein
LIALHTLALEPYRKMITTVVQNLLPLEPNHLELLATLDYLYRQLKAGGEVGPWEDRVIDRLFQVKRGQFPLEEVRAAYESMVRAGLAER